MSVSSKTKFSIMATFSIPAFPNREIQGVFSNIPNEGFFLELYDLPLNSGSHFFAPLICGTKKDAPHAFTLINVGAFESNISLSKAIGEVGKGIGRSVTKCRVEFCIFGIHYTKPEDLLFDKMKINFSNFREWVNKPTITENRFTEKVDEIKINHLEDIVGSLDDKFDFSIEFSNNGSYPSKDGEFEIHISQSVLFCINTKENQLCTLDEFFTLCRIIKAFFMFIQKGYVIEEDIWFSNSEKDFSGKFLVHSHHLAKIPSLKNKDFKFPYSRISLKFEKLLQKWIIKYKEMPHFFNSFFENIVKDNLSPEDKFENFIQSLLFYHNYRFTENKWKTENYAKFIEDMKAKLNEEEKSFIEKIRGQGNFIGMPEQIKRVLKQMEPYKSLPTLDNYVKEILSIRVTLSHSKIFQEPNFYQKLVGMTFNLNSILTNLIMFELDYDNQ